MAVITINHDNSCDHIPASECSSCDSAFWIFWNRNPVYERIEHCPFCGEEIEEFVEVGEGVDPDCDGDPLDM